MTANIDTFHSHKRKFLSDDDGFAPSARLLFVANQMETSCTSKKLKPAEPERVPPAPVEMDEPDEMMVCEDSTAKENNAGQMEATTESSQAMLVPKHCNGICDADASPTTLIMRCYCDPYRLNALIPYNSDIY